MVGLDQQSAPKQLIIEVPSHVVLVNNKLGAPHFGLGYIKTDQYMNIPKIASSVDYFNVYSCNVMQMKLQEKTLK